MKDIMLFHADENGVTVFAIVQADNDREILFADRDQYKSQRVFIRVYKKCPGWFKLVRLSLTVQSARRLLAEFGK